MLKLSLLLLLVFIIEAYSISNSVIDISALHHKVNLTAIQRSGIAAVIHKATEGTTHKDPYFKFRRLLTKTLNLMFGAYHVAQAGNPVKQAEYFLKNVGDTRDILLVLDLERTPSGRYMSPHEAEKFVKTIKRKTGRYPVLYGSSDFLEPYRKYHLNKCSLWVGSRTAARQPTLPRHRPSWTLWQYTDGRVGGAPRAVKGIGICSRTRYHGSIRNLRVRWPNL